VFTTKFTLFNCLLRQAIFFLSNSNKVTPIFQKSLFNTSIFIIWQHSKRQQHNGGVDVGRNRRQARLSSKDNAE